MDLSPGAQRLMAYWGSVESSVSQRATTADLWAAVHNAAAALGETISGITIQDMNVLRSSAAGIRNSADNLARASGDQVITATEIAQAPWARALQQQELAPMFQIRFTQDVLVGGEVQSLWRTVVIQDTLDNFTAGGLSDLIATEAEAIADAHGTTSLGVSSFQILAV